MSGIRLAIIAASFTITNLICAALFSGNLSAAVGPSWFEACAVFVVWVDFVILARIERKRAESLGESKQREESKS